MPAVDETNHSTGDRVHTAMTVFGVLIVVLHAVAAFFPNALSWGFHHLAFVGLPFRLVILAVMAAAFVPAVQRAVVRFSESLLAEVRKSSLGRLILGSSLALMAAGYFWIGREQLFLLGDGALVVRNLASVSRSSDVARVFLTAPLSGLIFWIVSRLLQGFADSTRLAVQLTSVAFGVGSLYVIARLSALLAEKGVERLLVFLFIAAGGTAQLYFGYVETYPSAFFGLLVFLWWAIDHARGSRHLLYPALAFGVMVTLHVGLLCMSPVLLLLLYRSVRKGNAVRAAVAAGGAVLAASLILLLSGDSPASLWDLFHGEKWQSLFVGPAPASGRAYAMFSFWHLVDFLNLFLLLSPFALPIIAVAALFRPAEIVRRDPDWTVLSLAAICGSVFVAMMRSDLGLSRDWDLAAGFVMSAILLSAWLLPRLCRNEARGRRLMVMIVIVTLGHSIPWIVVNAGERGLDRFMMLLDKRFSGTEGRAYAYEELGILFRDRGDSGRALECFQRSASLDSLNGRRWRNCAVLLGTLGRFDEMAEASRLAIRGGQEMAGVFVWMSAYLTRLGEADRAIQVLRRGSTVCPGSREIPFAIAETYRGSLGDCASALPFYRDALSLDPGFAPALLYAGDCCRVSGKEAEMVSFWSRYLVVSPTGPDADTIRTVLESVQKNRRGLIH